MITDVKQSHIAELDQSMRDIDRKEMVLAGYETLEQYVNSIGYKDSVKHSFIAPNGNLMGIGGVYNINEKFDNVWILTTWEVEKYPVVFCRDVKKVIAKYEHPDRIMNNGVHKDNKIVIQWLERLGFELFEPNENNIRGFIKKCVQ